MPKTIPAYPAAPILKDLSSPSSIASEIADRFFGSSAKPKTETTEASTVNNPGAEKTVEVSASSMALPESGKKPDFPAKSATEILAFVSENDVRRAMTRSEKIFIGRKTILTPSARDLGLEHEVFVETEAGSIR
jgi:hypothetical protein